MQRITRSILTLILIGVLMLPATTATARPVGPCADRWFSMMKPADGSRVVAHRVHALVGCAVRAAKAMELATAYCIVDRESGGWPWAHSSSSYGLFQLNLRYWSAWRDRFLRRAWFPHWPPSVFNARANVLAAMGLAREQGLAPWGGGCA